MMIRLNPKLLTLGTKILKKSKIFVPFVVVALVLAGLFTVSNKSEVHSLGEKIEKLKNTTKPSSTSSGKTQSIPSLAKISPKIEAKTITSTKTTGTTPNPTAVPATPTITPTPAPVTSGAYVVDGASFSSLYPTVSLKPGDQKVAFRITSTGTKTFTIYDARVIGLDGFSFSPMSGSINPGETKDIILSVDSSAKPGTYGGFIGIKVDSGYPQQKLNITVTIEGGDANTPSIHVTGPANGSTYHQGDQVTITWDATNISGDFSISVAGENGDTYSFANVSNSTHSYNWTATKFFAPNATHFRFTVSGGSIVSHADGEIIIN